MKIKSTKERIWDYSKFAVWYTVYSRYGMRTGLPTTDSASILLWSGFDSAIRAARVGVFEGLDGKIYEKYSR